jgi:hypothetical protein
MMMIRIRTITPPLMYIAPSFLLLTTHRQSGETP